MCDARSVALADNHQTSGARRPAQSPRQAEAMRARPTPSSPFLRYLVIDDAWTPGRCDALAVITLAPISADIASLERAPARTIWSRQAVSPISGIARVSGDRRTGILNANRPRWRTPASRRSCSFGGARLLAERARERVAIRNLLARRSPADGPGVIDSVSQVADLVAAGDGASRDRSPHYRRAPRRPITVRRGVQWEVRYRLRQQCHRHQALVVRTA